MTTDKRQITALVKQILSHHKVDNLAAEIDLICAFQRYVTERKAGKDIAQIRIDILADMQVGAALAGERESMEGRISKALGINPSATPALWDTVIAFLIKADGKGQRIERFAEACAADPYNMPKTHQIAQKPSLIQSMWPKVFTGEIETATADSDGGYR